MIFSCLTELPLHSPQVFIIISGFIMFIIIIIISGFITEARAERLRVRAEVGA